MYRPFIYGWFLRRGVQLHDAEDMSHDVLAVLVRKLPDFVHNGERGSFRNWLRTVAGNRAKKYYESQQRRPDLPEGGSFTLESLGQLENATSELTQLWNQEHDRYLFRRLFEVIEGEYEAQTVAIFRRVVVDGEKPPLVADEFGVSIASVYAAKSRLLARLRKEIARFME